VISEAYRSDTAEDGAEGLWLEELSTLISPGGRILDLGCGNGIPAARWLAAHGHDVTGIDISPVQIARARRLVPNATFQCADITRVAFPDNSFDAIVSFFAIIHIPVEEQPALLENVQRWLVPGGTFMAIVGSKAWTGIEEDWLGAGAPMYWSTADTATYLQWLGDAGLCLQNHRFIAEGTGGHTLIVARKP
jgi:ubiquinone/menaquinone biosynthesis C-methylase UbiE